MHKLRTTRKLLTLTATILHGGRFSSVPKTVIIILRLPFQLLRLLCHQHLAHRLFARVGCPHHLRRFIPALQIAERASTTYRCGLLHLCADLHRLFWARPQSRRRFYATTDNCQTQHLHTQTNLTNLQRLFLLPQYFLGHHQRQGRNPCMFLLKVVLTLPQNLAEQPEIF